jgi:hypothetical protein
MHACPWRGGAPFLCLLASPSSVLLGAHRGRIKEALGVSEVYDVRQKLPPLPLPGALGMHSCPRGNIAM